MLSIVWNALRETHHGVSFKEKKKGILLKIIPTVSLQMQLPNVAQSMLIVHT